MKELEYKKINDSSEKISIGYFDIYNSVEDRILLKTLFKVFFRDGDLMYFFLERQESLTDDKELKTLSKSIIQYFKENGHYYTLFELDDIRFTSIGSIIYDMHTPNFLIDCWKYFYCCNFFKPAFDYTLDEYAEYIEEKGRRDIDCTKHLSYQLSNFVFIKGLGADYLTISYRNGEQIKKQAEAVIRLNTY